MSRSPTHRKAQNHLDRNGAQAPPTALEGRLAKAQSRLSPRRQQMVRKILANSEQTCFLSSIELARLYHVDPATIIRTIQALGYESFADFTADLRQHFVTRITPYTALKAATQKRRSLTDHLDASFDKALENINNLISQLDKNRVVDVAKMIHRSRNIVIVGVDLAASLASYLAYGLVTLGFNADAPMGSEGNLQHKVEVLTPKDMLIAMSFGQCLRVTVEAVLRAKKQGVPTVGITDGDTTPIARYSDSYFVAPVVSPTFLNSYVAPMALISAIHVACAHVDPKRSLTQLKQAHKDYGSGPRWYREPKPSLREIRSTKAEIRNNPKTRNSNVPTAEEAI
jgi:DNA-binding MurR/RpiR family transcriptional regulator